MKVFLIYKDRDFDLNQKLPWNEQALTQDLELDTLFGAMALDDEFLLEVAKKTILAGLNDPEAILHRQNILRDCLKNPSVVRDLYDITLEVIERKKHLWWIGSKYPGLVLSGSIEVMQLFLEMLKKLRAVADKHADKFESEGFGRFFGMLKKELTDEYFADIQSHLRQLKFRDGVLVSAELGKGNKGANYILHTHHEQRQSWLRLILLQFRRFICDFLRMPFNDNPPVYTFYLHPRDEAGARALSELRDRGINLVANALAQSTDHIQNFFTMLRTELAFYVGCLNLHGQLFKMGAPLSFPVPVASSERRHTFKGVYDVCLALTMHQRIIGNDANADEKKLVIITGANQGGKSTFLRSIGLSQLMMQCGMFVPAESFCSNICDSLFTHYKREEDTAMESGKFDEELGRMSEIVDNITSNSMVLFNESFAATNEREGSEIARQIVSALLEKQIKVFFVTHSYQFAHAFYETNKGNIFFLRAERQADGVRTFKLTEGEPLQTSFGEDLYDRIFANT
jgi:DNA mismatch repair ATPase MutS